MPRILLIPAATAALLLAGCTAGGIPAPTPAPSVSGTESATPTSTPSPSRTPVTVERLPSTAFLRASVTAIAPDGSEMRVVVTVRPPRFGLAAQDHIDRILEECPNAVASQLDVYAGFEPTGVIVSEVVATGTWNDDDAVGISPGSFIANLGIGDVFGPVLDPEIGFGCTIPVLTGPGRAQTVSLLIGDPAVPDAEDVEMGLLRGVFGVQEAPGDTGVRWRDCVIQLGSHAERLAERWYPPQEWGRGCLIGYGGGA